MLMFRTLIREPLVHFLLVGFVLYLAVLLVEGGASRQEIVVDEVDIERLSATYRKQFGIAPSAEQLARLIDHHIREEIFWREGLALGLDRDDSIVRRRVAQKFEFLSQDLAVQEDPGEQALRDFLVANARRYQEPARVSFTHVYLAADRAGEERLETVASQLRDSDDSTIHWGDSFPGPVAIEGTSEAELRRLFGDSELVAGAFAAPPGVWVGPLASGYGMHFIRVAARSAERLPALDGVRERVLADYLDQRRVRANERAYAELLDKYRVTVAGERL